MYCTAPLGYFKKNQDFCECLKAAPDVISRGSSLFQALADREGKRCLFCVKTHNKTFEMSASDQRKKVEWTQGELWRLSRNTRTRSPFNHSDYNVCGRCCVSLVVVPINFPH